MILEILMILPFCLAYIYILPCAYRFILLSIERGLIRSN